MAQRTPPPPGRPCRCGCASGWAAALGCRYGATLGYTQSDEMTVLVEKAGSVLSPELRAELQSALPR